MNIFSYLFWPNLGISSYDSPKIIAFLSISIGLVVGSFIIKHWRKNSNNPITKKLSRSWASAAFWFGIVGLFLTISRVEGISYVSMRFWWVVWSIALAFYFFLQLKLFRSRHYTPVKTQKKKDPRDKYLPKKK